MINCCRSYCIILEPEENQKQKKIKTPRIPKITLINLDQSKTIVLLEDAMKLAKRNNFHLIKLLYTDGSDEREVYKLCTHKEIIANETERNDNVKNHESIKFKSFKVFSIDTKITEYDLDVKLKNINKLLQKGHRIKLLLKHYDNQKVKKSFLQ
ncbi:hypothetical protein WN55_08078 [Dufourea novaeangliae]|uniref:Uncharacterized protein n=1 Tax=Dufourea novaeangliae TaxID=178035 RepID=A0A154P737_DUFNO|nr:hypothetical protein WN55_08078 [Dufourea novaeangliae]